MARGASRSRSSAATQCTEQLTSSENNGEMIMFSAGLNNGEMIMFSDEDIHQLRRVYGDDLETGPNYIQLTCGCTSRKYGDQGGRLTILSTGQFIITCQCSLPALCDEEGVLNHRGKLTPQEFEKHSREDAARKWGSNIWIQSEGKKVPIRKTTVMKYYRHAANEGMLDSTIGRRSNFHRDEFLRCSKCKRERRFRLRNTEDCRSFHNASMNTKWKCGNHPHDKIKCGDEEERASRKSRRGCPRRSACKGCTSCVCLGCLHCRFLDCNCRTCVDFLQNNRP